MTQLPIVPPGLENDPQVYEAMKELALAAIHNARDHLEHSAPSVQMQVVRMLLPQVTKSLAHRTENDDDELKSELAALYQAVRDAIGVKE